MKVNSPLRWRIIEFVVWLRCWTGDALSRVWRCVVCATTHRAFWWRYPVHHSYRYHCDWCGREWMIHE